MRFATAFAASMFLFGATAHAATYYVATNGNDAASGSIDAPFRTVSKAAGVVAPGDAVNVRGGTYYENVRIYSKGTASNRIVFRAMSGENVILDGSNGPNNKGVVELSGAEYVDFAGFEVRNSPYIGIVLWHARNVRVLSNHVHHTTRNGIYAGADAMGGSSDITVSGNSVHDTVLENQYHTSNTGGWAGAIVVSKTNRATITDNRIWNNDGEGLISLRGNDHLVERNEIFDNFSVNLYLDNARGVTANRNLIYSTGNSRYFRNGLPAAGISIANETKDVMNPSSDNTFTNNIVIGTRWGFHYGNYESGGGLKNTKFLHNTIYRTVAEAIRIEDDTHSNNLIQNNIIDQTGSAALKYVGGSATVYRNNLWYGGSAGAAAGAGDIYANPMFVNPGGLDSSDYKLRLLSPAVHTALDIASVTKDYFGANRTPTSDIGAHEQSIELGSSAPIMPSIFPPASVSASLTTSGAVRVSWTTVTGATAYNVYRNGQYLDSFPTNGFVDSNVASSTTYTYEVTTADSRGAESARSMIATVTTAAPVTAAPVVPSGLIAVATATRVDLSWTATSSAVGYEIYRDGAKIATTSSSKYTDDSVSSRTGYAYHVVAVTADGSRSASSEVIRVTTSAPGRSRAVR